MTCRHCRPPIPAPDPVDPRTCDRCWIARAVTDARSPCPNPTPAREEQEMSIGVIINPGTGPVTSATLRHAWSAARVLRRDLEGFARAYRDDHPPIPWSDVRIIRRPRLDSNGRYGFVFKRGHRRCELDMPGLPIERVRYVGSPGQNIWHFPRIYIDDSSWVWMYAVSSAREALSTPKATP